MTRSGIAAAQEEAAAWVARMDTASWSPQDDAGLQAWLGAHRSHAGLLLQAQAIWMALDAAAPAGEIVPPDPEPAKREIGRRRLLAGGLSAAAAALAGWIGWTRLPAQYSTEIGEIRRVTLEDGSVAAINTDSSIRVSLQSGRRDIALESGEAWFQVAKDPERPLTVSAGQIRVRAVGTAFSVRLAPRGAEVLVTEGVVEVWPDDLRSGSIRLMEGEGAFVTEDASVRRLSAAHVEHALAWRFGKIDLVGRSLADAAEEFNRYNRRQIIVADPAIGAELLDGTFQLNDPEGFVVAIRETLPVTLDLKDPVRIIISGTSDRTKGGNSLP